jgi:hypothetical protein
MAGAMMVQFLYVTVEWQISPLQFQVSTHGLTFQAVIFLLCGRPEVERLERC